MNWPTYKVGFPAPEKVDHPNIGWSVVHVESGIVIPLKASAATTPEQALEYRLAMIANPHDGVYGRWIVTDFRPDPNVGFSKRKNVAEFQISKPPTTTPTIERVR
jgi:hypothetical protein